MAALMPSPRATRKLKMIDISTRIKDFDSVNINPRDYLEKYTIIKVDKDKNKYVLSDYSYFYEVVYAKTQLVLSPLWTFCSFDQIKYTKFFDLNEVKTKIQEIKKLETRRKLDYIQGNEQLDLYDERYIAFINSLEGTSYCIQKRLNRPDNVKNDVKYQIMSGIKYVQLLKNLENERTIEARKMKKRPPRKGVSSYELNEYIN